MKVFLLKDVEKVGIAEEMLKVKEGFAINFLLPKKFAVAITPENEHIYQKKIKNVENRKEAIATKTSILAEKIKSLKFTLKRKMHEDKLYGAISPVEIVELLDKEGVKVSKGQIIFDKPIKTQGSFDVTIKLSNQLQPKLIVKIIPE